MITIKRKEDIQNLFKEKNRVDLPDLYLSYRKTSLDKTRFLFVASKKTFRKAVERNRAKRLLRQAVRSALKNYNIVGFDIAIIAKKGLIEKKVYDIIPQIILAFQTIRERCLVG